MNQQNVWVRVMLSPYAEFPCDNGRGFVYCDRCEKVGSGVNGSKSAWNYNTELR